MQRYPTRLIIAALILLTYHFSFATKKSEHGLASFAKYVDIPGAKPVGTETCTTCHSEIAKDFRHAFHAQQGIDCEQCHGPGSLHVDGGGDVSKIVAFSKRSPADANGVCLSCHVRDEKIRNWMAGAHASNKVRCIDCHQTHAKAEATTEARLSFESLAVEHGPTVQDLVPESKAILQPRSQANDACLRCHQSQRGEMSLPYHHPLREGKMACADCHDPHGGVAGNNLRAASTNQLCLTCHSQYRGPFSYQHPPVNENCMNCHTPHGSPNTNLLTVSEPALCLQCHAAHHNGASLPLVDRCTNCHGSIHGTDVASATGGSVFIDKGPNGLPGQARAGHAVVALASSHPVVAASTNTALIPSHTPTSAASMGMAGMGVGLGSLLSGMLPTGSMSSTEGGQVPGTGEAGPAATYSAISITPGAYRFLDKTGYGGRVGEYDSQQQSAGGDLQTAYVSSLNHMTVLSRGSVVTAEDYNAASQLTVGETFQAGFDFRSFVQQQDNYRFYSNQMSPDINPTESIPTGAMYGIKRRLGNAYGRVKVPKLPVHLFVKGDWQARVGGNQLAWYDMGGDASCNSCHYYSGYQDMNYTTRNIGGGAEADLGPVRLSWEHDYSSFNDRLTFPSGVYGATLNSAEPGPVPVADVPPGSYYMDIPSPNQASADSVNLNWTASPQLTFNGNLAYTRAENIFTGHPQNSFDSNETLVWHPKERLRVTTNYHQQNLANGFTPYFGLYGNMSYHRSSEGVRLDYDLAKGLDAEVHYSHSDITRSNASLWPQIYSPDNTDLLTVIPSSFSNTTGLSLRYHASVHWSSRAGYEWTGTHDPGYLTVPGSNNRIFADFTLTPINWLVFTNYTSVNLQNAFPVIQRRNRLYLNTTSATFRVLPQWNLGLGYSYQQMNLATYMAFQNDAGAGYVLDEPLVPYKQISQTYFGDSSYTLKKRLSLALRLSYNSARSGFRPNIDPGSPTLFGNGDLIQQGAFDAGLFQQALSTLQLSSTQISQVIVPQWIGQTKAAYLFPHRMEGGLIFYYGSYRDYWNPGLNGVLRTFNVYAGRSW